MVKILFVYVVKIIGIVFYWCILKLRFWFCFFIRVEEVDELLFKYLCLFCVLINFLNGKDVDYLYIDIKIIFYFLKRVY